MARRPTKEHIKGVIAGYDVRSGKQMWRFTAIPGHGQPGNETWLNESWTYTGNTGSWAQMSADEQLGHVYVPVEAPTGDYYGGHRHGDNLYSSSLVALDVKTGRRLWHFQTTHHDIWDWDMPSAPILADITVDGRAIKAVAVPTKQNWLYVFDRTNGTAGVADRRDAGAEGRTAGRVVRPDAADSEQAAGVRPPGLQDRGSDRLHARDQGQGRWSS